MVVVFWNKKTVSHFFGGGVPYGSRGVTKEHYFQSRGMGMMTAAAGPEAARTPGGPAPMTPNVHERCEAPVE